MHTIQIKIAVLFTHLDMKLPKINHEDLPKDVQDLVDNGAEFESIIDEGFAVDFPIGPEQHKNMKVDSAKKLVLHRRWVEEMEGIYKRYEQGRITKEEADLLMNESTDRKNTGRFT
jgi:hypothetical protein